MPRSMRSPTEESNDRLVAQELAAPDETNRAWLTRLGAPGGVQLDENGIILFGGSSLAAFRMRVAQSSMRRDLFPSYWSHCGILLGGGEFATVPLAPGSDVSSVPARNGVVMEKLEDFDDPERYPNVAVIRFALKHDDVRKHIKLLKEDRTIIDLPAMMLRWLGFVWGVTGAVNPLADGIGLPSAAFVETVFAMAGCELTPGLSSRSSCPEAIWQSARWWQKFYKESTVTDAVPGEETSFEGMPPEGFFVIRQPAAAITERDVSPRQTPPVMPGLSGMVRPRETPA